LHGCTVAQFQHPESNLFLHKCLAQILAIGREKIALLIPHYGPKNARFVPKAAQILSLDDFAAMFFGKTACGRHRP
jgi:hypothetical protein